jgi:hypothetical protein
MALKKNLKRPPEQVQLKKSEHFKLFEMKSKVNIKNIKKIKTIFENNANVGCSGGTKKIDFF